MGFAKKSNRASAPSPPIAKPSPTPAATASKVSLPSYRPASTVAAPPPPRAPTAPASTQQSPPPVHQPHGAAAPPAPQSSGPGLMGTFASSAAGSVAGNMIANSLFGGSRSPEAAAPVEGPAAQQTFASSGPVCTFESQQFLQCMSMTNDDLNQCQHLFDAFKQCNAQAN